MLADPPIKRPYAEFVAKLTTDDQAGYWLCADFNPHLMVDEELWEEAIDGLIRKSAPAKWMVNNGIHIHGVCDSPQQFNEVHGKLLLDSEHTFCVFLTKVERSECSPTGGWRWHKWGSYIGEHEPTTEYLYDEPEIEEVYCFTIFYKKEESDER